MEVASPLPFTPGAGTKRSLACSPQLFDTTNRAAMEISEEPPVAKRRRFQATTDIDERSSTSVFPFPNSPSKSMFTASQGKVLRFCFPFE